MFIEAVRREGLEKAVSWTELALIFHKNNKSCNPCFKSVKTKLKKCRKLVRNDFQQSSELCFLSALSTGMLRGKLCSPGSKFSGKMPFPFNAWHLTLYCFMSTWVSFSARYKLKKKKKQLRRIFSSQISHFSGPQQAIMRRGGRGSNPRG